MRLRIRHLAFFAATAVFAADPELIRLAGPDVKVLAGLSVASTLQSPFGQFMLGRMQSSDDGLKTFIDATGFDPRRDLREILVLSDGPRDKLLAASGVFNRAQFAAYAKAHGGTFTTYKGVQLVTNPRSSEVVAFADSSLALMGESESVKRAIDRRQKGSGPDPRLSGKADELSGAYDVWMLTLSPQSLAAQIPGNRLEGAANALQAIEQSSAGIKFGPVNRLAGEAVTRSDKDALALADVFKFVGGIMRAQGKGTSSLNALLDRVELTTRANLVQFSLQVSQAEIEQLFVRPARTGVQ